MSSRRIRTTVVAAPALSLVATSIAFAAGRDHGKKKDKAQFSAHLIGYNEVPSVNSPAHADLTLAVGDGRLTWSLTYADFVNQPVVAHVHIGQPGVSGGVSFFFCGGPKPACPSSASGPVTITGTTLPADIVVRWRGFAAGDLDSVVKAIQAGFSDANMHTSAFALGEIRGQLGAARHDDDRGSKD